MAQIAVASFQLSHLALGAPTSITVARVLHVQAGDLVQTTGAVEARGEFVGQGFDMHKTVVLGQLNRLFVQRLRFDQLPRNPGDFSSDQRRLTGEGFRTLLRPGLQLIVVLAQALQSVGIGFAVGSQR